MKKCLYSLLVFLGLASNMATQNVTNSLIIPSTLVLSSINPMCTFNRYLSLDLHKAIERGDYTAAQKLVANSLVDVNAKVDYDGDWYNKIEGCTPLIMCCKTGDQSLQVAKALLKHENINVNLQNDYGNTPLIWCCIKGDQSLAIAKLLLGSKNINVNLQSKYGTTPLIGCSWKGDEALGIAKALLARKEVKVNLQDSDGDTALDIIIRQIINNTEGYTYRKLWKLLVAKGTILGKHTNDYNNLNPSDFKEPQKSYVTSIKSTPPRQVFHQLVRENNLLRKELEGLKEKNNTNAKFMDDEEAKEKE